MALLDPASLPHDFPRSFVPAQANLGDWPTVEKLFSSLEQRPLSSRQNLERWLKDLGEFEDSLDEEGSIRYVRMTCATDNPQTEQAYLDFLQNISEPSKSRFFTLLKKYWDCPYRAELPPENFNPFNRSVENQLAFYREENIPLETEIEKFSQQYQKLSGTLKTV